MPRYVILYHETPPRSERPAHWDFMLEAGEVLRTWALDEAPRDGAPISAHALADHRPFYLDYEGEISAGRGTVARWDEGEYSPLSENSGQLSIRADGRRLHGRVEITQAAGERWTWRYLAD